MPRTSCSLDQGNCSGNCAYQCVRWDDGVRGHLVEVFERKIKSKTDDEHIETQALSSLPGRSRGQGFRQPQTELTLEFAITAPGLFKAVGKGGAERAGVRKIFSCSRERPFLFRQH